MADKVKVLRSLARAPDSTLLEWEQEQWKADVEGLSIEEFSSLIQPLLENDKAGLQGLPNWSRTCLWERWLLQH